MPVKPTPGSEVGVAGASRLGAAGTWVSITKEADAGALRLPAASRCVAETVCGPSASGFVAVHDQAPPADTPAWQTISAPCATVSAAPGSPVPEKETVLTLVGVGTAFSVGLAMAVFTTKAFGFPDGVASSLSGSSTSVDSTCGPSASFCASGHAQLVDLIGLTMQIAFPFSVTSR